MSYKAWYNQDADYNTNAKSYMDYLARHNKFMKVLVEDYEVFKELLTEEFKQFQLSTDETIDSFQERLDNIKQEMTDFFIVWLEDGTLEEIINVNIFNGKLDRSEFEVFKDGLVERFQTFETLINSNLSDFETSINSNLSDFEDETNELLRLQNEYLESEIEQKNAELEMLEDRNNISLGQLGAGNGIASWWTTPLAFRSYQYIFHGFTDNEGGVWVGRYDNERQENKYFRVIKNEVDDHNAPSVLTLSDGRVITFYSRHNQDTYLRYRISESVRDIDFGEEQTIKMDAIVTYAQAIVDTSTGRLYVFTRVASNTWRILSTPSENITDTIDWEINKEFVHFGDDNQGYLKIRYMSDEGMCRIAFSGHPTNGNMHDILYCYFRTRGAGVAGDVVSGGDTIKNILSEDWTPLRLSELQMVYDSNQTGKRARLFDIGDSLELCFVEFTTLTDGQYKYATWNGNGFDIKDVVPAGQVFGGGSQRYYYGGMMFSGHTNSSDIFLSRFINNEWVIERYTSGNNGDTWNVTEIERSKYYKLMRPYAVTNPSNFEQLMYSKGSYSESNFTDFKTIIKSW